MATLSPPRSAFGGAHCGKAAVRIKGKAAFVAEASTSYGQILRSSSIMGAAAAVNLLLGMVRVKFAAVLIGTMGTGLLASFTSIQLLATNIFGLGVQSSGVRTLAAAVAANDAVAVSRAALTLRRLCLLTGLAGMAATAMLSPIFSRITFGSDRYALDIAALGLVVLFTTLAGGQMALIQGMRRIGDIARINLLGAAAATAAAVIFYGVFGIRGIVPALVTTAGSQLLVSWLYARTLPLSDIRFGWRESLRESGGVIRLGFVFMWNGLLGSAVSYATVTLITQQVSLQAAGLFSAAFALSGIFVSFILGAMGADYYPRLTGAAGQPAEFRRLVNEQTEVGLLLALPGLIATMTLAPWAIRVFYTSEFLAATSLLHWFVLGCWGRVLSWPLGFVMPALGKGRWFFVTETTANLIHLTLIVVGIKTLGLVGVAVAFFLLYVAYTIAVLAIAHRLAGFSWSRDSVLLIALSGGVLFACLAAVKLLSLWPATLTGLVASLLIAVFSLRQLTRRLGKDHKLTKMAARIPILNASHGP